MKSQIKTLPETSTVKAHDFEAIKAQVLALEIKPFATDHLVVEGWRISAHACGYFLSKDDHNSYFRFGFTESEVEPLVKTLAGLLSGSLEMATCCYSGGGIWVQAYGSFFGPRGSHSVALVAAGGDRG